ncbi:hypothetical protein CPB84DRAFT_1724676 [Gymnopilus junonius]|uniref:F-box domain-containing protein n=1 Tax=Gymnopilus junonius TaxID=109634 RepID=A0A9P5NZ49_GYMJU|nr:hypothetical protein CPB84DRAFT_1724676 [Gymnopilus junonius]
MPPKLFVSPNARHEQRMQSEISSSLAAVLRKNPKMTPKEAMYSVTSEMLQNNPYQPLANGKCPINDLPNEILAHIFQLGVKDQEEEEEGSPDEDEWEDMSTDGENSDEDSDEDSVDAVIQDESGGQAYDSDSEGGDEVAIPFQVLVSHVCKRWREVAIESHFLWTNLNFAQRPRLEKAQVYISRAGGQPLDIYIDCTFPPDVDEEDHPDHPLYQDNEARKKRRSQSCDHPECSHEHGDDNNEIEFLSQKQLTQILDVIEPEVSHWQSLDFRASTYGYVHLLLSRLHKLPSASVLETLSICHFEDCDDYEFFSGDDMTSFLPFHGIAPNLKDVVLWGVHIDWDSPFLRGLSNLELQYHAKDVRPSYRAFAKMINSSPDLHSLTLSLSGPVLPAGVSFDADPEEHEGAWGPTPLTIPSLRELALQFHEIKYAIALVQHIDVPNLKSMLLDFDEEDYSSFVQTLVKPVKGRTESVLQHVENLKISGLPCDMASAEALLGQLVNLKSLNIKVVGPEEALIFHKLIDPQATQPPPDSAAAPQPAAGSSSRSDLARIFCPKLEAFTANQVDGAELRILVTKRRELGAPLKSLYISQFDEISKKDEKWLRANLEEVQFFEPSDSEEEYDDVEVILDEEGWTDEESRSGSEDEDGSHNEGDDDDEIPVDESGEPLISPLARHMRRSRGRGPTGNHDLD